MGTTKEAAAELRAKLKAHGWNSRQVSVRTFYASLMSELVVTIRDVRVPYWQVRALADEYERISRDSVTGEILGGGNRYLKVTQTDERCEILARRYIQQVEEAIATIGKDDDHTLEEVAGMWLVGRSQRGLDTFQLWHEGDPCRQCFHGDEYGVRHAALQIALHDADQTAGVLEVVK